MSLSRWVLCLVLLATDSLCIDVRSHLSSLPGGPGWLGWSGLEGAVANLRGVSNVTSNSADAPCSCTTTDPSWTAATRTTPRCVFINLGAADGRAYKAFLGNQYVQLSTCPRATWKGYLYEANPFWNDALQSLSVAQGDNVSVKASTAPYVCNGNTTFFCGPQLLLRPQCST